MILRQRWRSQGITYVLCLFTVHWPITNASTPLTVTPYWWQRSPIELRRRKSFSLCKFNKNDACFNMHLQLSLKVFIFPQCGACISVRVLIGEPLLHRWRALTAVFSPANRLCVWISPYGTGKGAAYGKKLLKTVLISVRCRTRSLPFKLFKSLLKKNLEFNEQRFNLS